MADSANPPAIRATDFVSAVCIGQLVNGCASGARRDALLAKLGLDPRHACAFEHRVPEDIALAVLAELSTDPAAPLKVARELREHHSPIFHLAAAEETVADLLDNACRYGRLIWSSMPLHVELGPDTAVLAGAAVPDAPGAYVLQRYILAEMCVSTARQFTAVPFAPLRVRLQGPAPADLEPWRSLAGAVEFGAPRGEIVLARSDLDLPLRNPDERMTTWLHGHLDRELEAVKAPTSVTEQVAALVRQSLARGPDRAEVSQRLGWSERTLGRRLGAEGTTFREVVDQVRFERAVSLLPDLSAADVSTALGFADLRSFERGFRRWTGTTPAAWLRERSS